MVNRIPQVGFIGPTPSEVVSSSAELGQRWGQLVANSIQEGMQLYEIRKQRKQEAEQKKQEAAAQNEELRIKLIADDIASKLEAAGEGNELSVFQANPAAFKELYTFYAKGNTELAESMLQSTESQFMRAASPSSLARMGMIQVQRQGVQGGAQPPAAGAPQQQGQVPGQQVQAPVPEQQPAPQAKAQVQAPIQQAQVPEQPTRTENALASNQQLMALLRAKAKELYPNESAKIDSLDNNGMLKEYPKTLNRLISGLDSAQLNSILGSAGEPVQAQSREGGASGATAKISLSKTSLNPAISKSVEDTFNRLDAYIRENAPTFDMSSKEQAAVKVAGNYVGTVLKDSPLTKAWIAAGGREEALQQAAESLAQYLNENPDAATYREGRNVFSEKETKEMLSFAKEDRLGQDMINDYNLGQDKIKNAQYQAAMKGYQAMASLLVSSDKTAATLSNARSKMTEAQIKADVEYRKLAATALKTLQDSVQKWSDDYAKLKPKATNEQRNDALNRAFTENATLRAAWIFAADAAAKVNGGTAEEVALQFKAAYLLNLPFNLGIGEISPAGETELPGIKLNPNGSKATVPAATKAATPSAAPTKTPTKSATDTDVDSYVNSLLGGN